MTILKSMDYHVTIPKEHRFEYRGVSGEGVSGGEVAPGFRVRGSGFRVWIQSPEFRVQGFVGVRISGRCLGRACGEARLECTPRVTHIA